MYFVSLRLLSRCLIASSKFRLFTGLLVNPSVYRKASAKKDARAESPDFDSDDDDDSTMNVGDAAAGESRPAKRQRSGEAFDLDDEEESDAQKTDEEIREEKISHFLGDPENALRIFLSSYMREHGLIWCVASSVIAYCDWLTLILCIGQGRTAT